MYQSRLFQFSKLLVNATTFKAVLDGTPKLRVQGCITWKVIVMGGWEES